MRLLLHATAVLLGLICLILVACKKSDDACLAKIRVIPTGTPRAEAEKTLRQCGLKTLYFLKSNSLSGDKDDQGVPVMKRTQISISLDAQSKVVSVVVTESLVGP